MRKGIIGAGNLIVDKIKVIDRWPGEGNLCNIRSTVSSAGGGPCNVLFDIAAADPSVPLYIAGRIGNDDDGAYLLKTIAEHGVDSSNVVRSSTAPTSYTASEIASRIAKFDNCPIRFFYSICGLQDGTAYASASRAAKDLPQYTDLLTEENWAWQECAGTHSFEIWNLGLFNFLRILGS